MPFFSSGAQGGPNQSMYMMTDYLHQINAWTYYDSSNDNNNTLIDNSTRTDSCDLLQTSVTGWLNAEQRKLNHLDVSFDDDDPFVVWARLEPVRCDYPYGIITKRPEECNLRMNDGLCEFWEQASHEDLNRIFQLRKDYLVKVVNTNENGVVTTVIFNVKDTVSLA